MNWQIMQQPSRDPSLFLRPYSIDVIVTKIETKINPDICGDYRHFARIIFPTSVTTVAKKIHPPIT